MIAARYLIKPQGSRRTCGFLFIFPNSKTVYGLTAVYNT